MPRPHEELENDVARNRDRLMFVVGSGVSRASCSNAPCASWTGLLQNGIDHCKNHQAALSPDWVTAQQTLLKVCRTPDLIQVATAIQSELASIHSGEFGRWLSETIGRLAITDNNVIRALETWNVQFATTNYDTLLEQVLQRKSITWREPALAHQFLLKETLDVFHFHGTWQYPESVILGAKSYEDIVRDPHTRELLRSSFFQRTLVFVGCGGGLDDPNFGSLLEWSRSAMAGVHHRHYVLVRSSDIASVQAQCAGIPLRVVDYGASFSDLAPFLTGLSSRASPPQPTPEVMLLQRAQDDFESQYADLERNQSDIPGTEFLSRLEQIVDKLRQRGGTRSSWWRLGGAFQQQASALEAGDRFRLGLIVAEMMLDDEVPGQALTILQLVEEDVNAVATEEGKTQYSLLRAQCFSDLGAYSQTLDALSTAIEQTTDAGQRERLEAERDEIRFLQNDVEF